MIPKSVVLRMKVLDAQSCPTLCDLIDCRLPGSSVHGILQARRLEWVAIPFSRGSSWPRGWTPVSCIAGRFFTIWATNIKAFNLCHHLHKITLAPQGPKQLQVITASLQVSGLQGLLASNMGAIFSACSSNKALPTCLWKSFLRMSSKFLTGVRNL